MLIRKGIPVDLAEIEQLYDDLHDYLAAHVNHPGWLRGIYPIRQDAEDGIGEDNLFVAVKDAKIVGTFILRRKAQPAYDSVDWGIQLPNEEVFVVYTMAVHPDYLRTHIGDTIMSHIIRYAKQSGIKVIRLDVYSENIPAIKLYEKHGFHYVAMVDMEYGKHGLNYYKLYQYILD